MIGNHNPAAYIIVHDINERYQESIGVNKPKGGFWGADQGIILTN